jgi:hypothetical protein
MSLKCVALMTSCTWIACNGSPSNQGAPPSEDAAIDAGDDAAAACDSPDATTALACGTLDFAKSPVASRPRNHHVTLLAPTSSGTVLYAIGGANVDSSLAFVDSVPIGADGSLGAWVSGPPLPVGSGGLVGDLVSGVIVVAGGTTSGSTVTDRAYSSVVQPDGTLGAWQPAGSVLEGRMHAGSFAKGNTMWIMGGFDNQTVWSDIVSATVQPDGTVSAWTPAGQLPGPRSHFSVTVIDAYVYIAGGLALSAFNNPPLLDDVWRGQIQADGSVGGWKQMKSLPVAEATQASFFYGGYLHLCGGINETSETGMEDRCWRAPIESDHTIGSFEEIAPLLKARGHVHQMPVLGQKVYSIAGATDYSLDSTTEIDIGTFGSGPQGKRAPRPVQDAGPGAKPHKGPVCHLGAHPKTLGLGGSGRPTPP